MTNASFELVEFKADEERRGLFAALVSVFGNTDRNGDRVMKGAFTRTLKEWMARGKPIPVVWSHDHMEPQSYIGSIDPADVKETDQGLVVAGTLDVETNPKAAQVWQLLKDGRIDQWSFAYDPVGKRASKAPGARRDLLDLDLFEVGPTLIGANAETRTLAVKSAEWMPDFEGALSEFDTKVDAMVEEKIGRVLSRKTEAAITDAIARLQELLSTVGPEEQEEQADDSEETKVDEEEPQPVTVSAEAASLQQAENFLAERGRLQLVEAESFLAERVG